MIWDEGVHSSSEHFLCVVLHKWVGLDMQISKHFVGSPTPNETDDVGVDIGQKKCSGAGRTETAGGDITWEEAQLGA